jgi:hypothetical protein
LKVVERWAGSLSLISVAPVRITTRTSWPPVRDWQGRGSSSSSLFMMGGVGCVVVVVVATCSVALGVVDEYFERFVGIFQVPNDG